MTTLHRLRKLAPEEFGTRFSPGAWARLAKHYGCPPRAYHNLEHILSFAEWFHTLEGEWQRPSEVFAALLFHDAIYDALATNNESRSASLACEALAHIELDLELVARLIRSSDPTAPRPSTPAG